MNAIGFSHFAAESPNHLAIAAPDGRHWSRAELLAECARCARGRAPEESLPAPDSAEYLAIQLAASQTTSPSFTVEQCRDSGDVLDIARQLMAPLGMLPQGDHIHYMGFSLQAAQSLAWAMAGLHYGHPLIVTDNWNPHHLLRAVQQYRVTTCYLSDEQFRDLAATPRSTLDQYDLSSLRDILADGQPCPNHIVHTDCRDAVQTRL